MNELESHYSALSPLQMIEKEPQIGLPCVVRYTEDKQFYRSEIVKLNDKGAEVLFLRRFAEDPSLRRDETHDGIQVYAFATDGNYLILKLFVVFF